MSAASVDLTIEQGATFVVALNFNGPEDQDGDTGTPIDVSEWVFAGQIKSNYSSPIDIQDFTFNVGLETNQILMSLTAAQTAALPVRSTQNYQITPSFYSYDVFATRPDTTVLKIIFGSIILIPQVTVPA
jgi:hypothetical protein